MYYNCKCLCNKDPGSITVFTTASSVKVSCKDLYGPYDCTYDEFCNCNGCVFISHIVNYSQIFI
jgi:hypothetical protein